jgi:hypothetical protein
VATLVAVLPPDPVTLLVSVVVLVVVAVELVSTLCAASPVVDILVPEPDRPAAPTLLFVLAVAPEPVVVVSVGVTPAVLPLAANVAAPSVESEEQATACANSAEHAITRALAQ